MSEYIEIEAELSDDGVHMQLTTNLVLTAEEQEVYDTPAEMEEGSPLAQALSIVPGITHLVIAGSELTLAKEPQADWHAIIGDISAAIKDFFL